LFPLCYWPCSRPLWHHLTLKRYRATARDAPILIEDLEGLDAIRNDLEAHYTLANDIDASATLDPNYNDGKGWNPIGSESHSFSGTFDGDGHTISRFFINRISTNHISLFGFTSDMAEIKNIGLVDVDVSGNSGVGGLVGINDGKVNTAHFVGPVLATGANVGGQIGVNNGTVENSYWNNETSGQLTSAGGEGRNTSDMNDKSRSWAGISISYGG